ncbi:geranylgeranyl reductase family protein [Actinoplanes sp. LDG1-06]|uniref:Geranylgeranyl reductase family protein n=1 Tax=Paractinoplanes ovalisporus TaxID=2810368 RepID=A0ABS2AE01_9ACTN|nr:geranylgeranyl reductase family protein [Actinoplanes ovalisporus]MBM2618039.1 geranylgeranyl reductase family protein [Actinoplanes ovalisporus]
MRTSVHNFVARLPLVSEQPAWDVAVVGGGPAGLSAARAAAAAGARTIVLERAEHPRYKTCGGGLIGTSLSYASAHIDVPARDRISALTFTRDGRRSFTRRASGRPFLTLVRRDDFDHAWYSAAVAAGAVVRQNSQVRSVEQNDDVATVTLAGGDQITAGVVIGADGSAGITSRYVGVTFEQQDLGLEVELAATPADRAAWQGRVLLDWGPFPGSYGWVFPKEDELTVGVIMAKGHGAATKEYLNDFVSRLGFADRPVVRDSGHLTRCRHPDAPLRRGRVVVVGDAAGLLEPWTREGISYALRSGSWAGAAWNDLSSYEHRVAAELVPEMTAGRRLLNAFSRLPGVVHLAMATPLGWRAFETFCRGDLSMAHAIRRPGVRALLALFRA